MKEQFVTLNAGKHSFTFDQARAGEVCVHLAQAWRDKEKFYSQCLQPEIICLPDSVEYGSRLHALYLFGFAELNRAGNSTDRAVRDGAALFAKYPWMIDPLKRFDPKKFMAEMVGVMSYVSLVTPKGKEEFERRVNGWYGNLQILKKQYDSNPLNIFLNAQRSREGLVKELMQFYGFGHKVAQLAILWFQDISWPDNKADWEEINKIPAIPADMWLERSVNNLGFLISWSGDHRESASLPVSDFLVDVCVKYNISWSDLSQALWHLGATICKKVPKHRPRNYCQARCPAYHFCIGRTSGSLHTRHNQGHLRWAQRGNHDPVLFDEPESLS